MPEAILCPGFSCVSPGADSARLVAVAGESHHQSSPNTGWARPDREYNQPQSYIEIIDIFRLTCLFYNLT
jgi:hypothetical protein